MLTTDDASKNVPRKGQEDILFTMFDFENVKTQN